MDEEKLNIQTEEELFDYLKENYNLEDIADGINQDLVDYVTYECDSHDILNKYDDESIINYLESSDASLMIFYGDDEVLDYLSEHEVLESNYISSLFRTPGVDTFRRQDCLDLMTEYASKEGWNSLFEKLSK